MLTSSFGVLKWISRVLDGSSLELVPLLLQGLELPPVGLDLGEELLHLDDLIDEVHLLLRVVALPEVL